MFFFFLLAIIMQLFKYYFLTETWTQHKDYSISWNPSPPIGEKMKIFCNFYYEKSLAKHESCADTEQTGLSLLKLLWGLSVYDRHRRSVEYNKVSSIQLLNNFLRPNKKPVANWKGNSKHPVSSPCAHSSGPYYCILNYWKLGLVSCSLLSVCFLSILWDSTRLPFVFVLRIN